MRTIPGVYINTSIKVSGCNNCPYNKEQEDGRSTWSACFHSSFDKVWGHHLWVFRDKKKETPKWCPLGLGEKRK